MELLVLENIDVLHQLLKLDDLWFGDVALLGVAEEGKAMLDHCLPLSSISKLYIGQTDIECQDEFLGNSILAYCTLKGLLESLES